MSWVVIAIVLCANYLDAPWPPANGLDYPVGNANGKVVSVTTEGQPWGTVVMIDHLYYENHHRRLVRSVYAGRKGTSESYGLRVMA